ncbi:MAG: hypothetical protein WC787_02190 [Patescibacteria group bacterium]|jgi:hypothetical protein
MEKFSPLCHENLDSTSDEALEAEANVFLDERPNLQFLADLLQKLRDLKVDWWAPDELRKTFPIEVRTEWLRQRPDIRQRITVQLAGIRPKSARKMNPAAQAELINIAIDEGDITVDEVEQAFAIKDYVVYGDVPALSKFFRNQMPWIAIDQPTKDLAETIFESLLRKREGYAPLMTHLQMRMAINEKVWQQSMPLDVHMAIARARLESEKADPSKPFLAEDELRIATIKKVVNHVKLDELYWIYEEAEKVMGFAPETIPSVVPPAEEPKTVDQTSLTVVSTGRPTPLVPPANTVPTALRPPATNDSTESAETSKDAPSVEVSELDQSDVAVSDSGLPPSSESSETDSGPKSLEEQYPHAPRLEMDGVNAVPPPKKEGDSKSGRHSSLSDLSRKMKAEPELLKFGIEIKNMEDYPTQDLEDLLSAIDTKLWPEDPKRRRAICLSFLRDRDPKKFAEQKEYEELGDNPVIHKFCAALQQCDRNKLYKIAQALENPKKGPPPLPADDAKQKTG